MDRFTQAFDKWIDEKIDWIQLIDILDTAADDEIEYLQNLPWYILLLKNSNGKK
jgi:hypothetical protein